MFFSISRALLSLVGAGLAVRHGREFMPRPARHAEAHVPPMLGAKNRYPKYRCDLEFFGGIIRGVPPIAKNLKKF